MGNDIDWKNIGTKAIDIVAGVGGAVAGIYGGPAAASGIQNAGGAIKSLVDDGNGDKKPSRRDQHDRQDFQARAKPQAAAAPANPDEQVARTELAKLGYSSAQINAILAGPGQKEPQQTPPIAVGQTEKAVDGKTIAAVAASAIKGAIGVGADTYEGTNTAVLAKDGTRILAGSDAASAKS